MGREGRIPAIWKLVAMVALTSACAGPKLKSDDGGSGGAVGGGGNGGRASQITGLGNVGGIFQGFGGVPGDDGPGPVIGGDPLGDAACAAATQQAHQVPLDLYVMLDSSGSMLSPISATSTTDKWTAVSAALTSFLQDQKSAGLGVGLQYFPLIQPGVPDTCESTAACNGYGPCDTLKVCSSASTLVPCTSNSDCRNMGTCIRLGICNARGDSYCTPTGTQYLCTANDPTDYCAAIPGFCTNRDRCDSASYATPAVEVATLPGAAPALLASLNSHTPDGLTPTAGALSGAIAHAQALARANPTHKVAVLLATDGLPSECEPTDIAGVSALAAAAQAGNPSVPTFVIGVFGPTEMAEAQVNLDAIAAAGGTGKAFVISTNAANVTTSFVNALNAVRTAGLSCQYEVPASMQDGGGVDYSRVNVQFTSGSGQEVTIGNVKNRAACSATKGGWYYDVDPTTGAIPKTISICETSCAQMRADAAGKVEILLGCLTIIVG
jgi:hypothetical protein